MADANMKVSILAVDKASKTLRKIGGSLDKMGAVSLATAGAVTAFAASSVQAFAEAEAAQAKLQDTFDKFPRLADISIDALRAYNQELQRKTRFDDDALASGQAILGQYELTGQQLAELTPLVADYAAKTGQSFEDAAQQVGKAMLGQGRALKNVGIDFKDTGTQAGNLEQIMVGLRTQVGGFAEQEGKTAAGQVAIMKNQFGELQETVGAALVPTLTSLAGAASDLFAKFNALPTPVKDLALRVAGVTTAAIVLVPKMAELYSSLKNMASAATIGKARMAALASAAGLVTTAFVVATGAAATMRRAVEDAFEEFETKGTVDSLMRVRKEFDDMRAKQEDLNNSSGVWDTLSDGVESFAFRFTHGFQHIDDQVGEFADRLDRDLRDKSTVFQLVARRTGLTDDAVTRLAEKAGVDLTKGVSGASEALVDFYNGNVKGESATKQMADAQSVLNDEVSTGEDRMKAYRQQLDLMSGGTLNVEEANDRFRESLQQTESAMKENGNRLSGNTQVAIDNRAKMRDLVEQTKNMAVATFDQTGKQNLANQRLKEGRDAIEELGRRAGLSKEEVKRYTGELDKIPGKKSTTITANANTQPAKDAIGAYRQWAANQGITLPAYLKIGPNAAALLAGATPGSPAAARIAVDAMDGKLDNVGQRAKGGPVGRGSMYLVGEKGPELFVPGSSGYIVPNGAGGRGVGVGGVNIIVQTGQAVSTKDDIARAVADALKTARARGLVVA